MFLDIFCCLKLRLSQEKGAWVGVLCTGAQPSVLGMTGWLRPVCSTVAGSHLLRVVQISNRWDVWLLRFQLKHGFPL